MYLYCSILFLPFSVIAQPDMFVYNAVKGGVAQLTRCLALDLAKVGPIPLGVYHFHFLLCGIVLKISIRS